MLPRALVIAALVLSAGTARAELVTPDSVSPAPAGWVTDQYKRLGLVFVPVLNSWGDGTWAEGIYNHGAYWSSEMAGYNRAPDGTPLGPPEPRLQGETLSARFLMPGTGAPATTGSVRVHLYSGVDAVFTLTGYDSAGSQIGSRATTVSGGSDTWLTLRAPGMQSFSILSNWPPSPGPVFNSPPIEIEGIEFQPVPALPEPGGLVLSGLGTLILTVARLRQGLPRPAGRA